MIGRATADGRCAVLQALLVKPSSSTGKISLIRALE
jgi:hypothetical protein